MSAMWRVANDAGAKLRRFFGTRNFLYRILLLGAAFSERQHLNFTIGASRAISAQGISIHKDWLRLFASLIVEMLKKALHNLFNNPIKH